MSEVVEREKVESELKKAIMFGDINKVENILMQHKDVFSQVELVKLQMIVQNAKMGKFSVNDPELLALAAKM